MPRINVVEKSVKEHTCQRCKEAIPKGAGYRWIKPRYGSKLVHCMKPSCAFRPTDLSSSKAAVLEEVVEDAREDIEPAPDYEAIQDALQIAAERVREVAQEWQDASDNWAGGNGKPTLASRLLTTSRAGSTATRPAKRPSGKQPSQTRMRTPSGKPPSLSCGTTPAPCWMTFPFEINCRTSREE